jgi:vancomycin resistance protein YoaR
MTYKYTQLLNGASIGSLTGIALLLLLSNFLVPHPKAVDASHHAAPADPVAITEPCGVACDDTATGSSTILLTAKQLQSRLSASGAMVPSLTTLVHALEQRDHMKDRTLSITATDPKETSVGAAKWTVSLKDHPELMKLQTNWSAASYGIDRQALADMIVTGKFAGMDALTSISVSNFADDGKVTRAQNVPIAHDGYAYNSTSVAQDISEAFANGHDTLTLSVAYKQATVQMSLNGITKNLDLLSSGRSNYTGSPSERVRNVHKAINERLNNVVVKPGATFSYVDTLGGPVTLDKGWVMGLGLFGGGAALTPGAGICQGATTTYRAALLAGFPIVEKRNHSMWVDHYEPFGAGLDATIFPGVHDMRFKNDSTSTILIQSSIDESTQDVTVNIYGTDDHRAVALDGPYFWNTPHRPAALRPLGKDESGWTDTVTYADGKKVESPIISTYYKGIPRKVISKYATVPGETILHEMLDTGATLAAMSHI